MSLRLGATPLPGARCRFTVWAPRARRVDVHLLEPDDRAVGLERGDRGYHVAVVDGVPAGARYRFRLDGDRELPDPASRFQPRGVDGPSEVIDSDHDWTDGGWGGVPLRDYVLYELHVGTFSAEGTFDGVARHLDELVDLGVTAVELMPVAQFPGTRNWGYDGVFPFAVQDSYGGPAGLRSLVDACHGRGLAVVLDVVYNHLGPEGNVLEDFGPYFTDRYVTPWGPALNVDGPGSDEVRRYFIENALRWLEEFHVDALRLDAVHGIVDTSAYPFLEELADAVHALPGRRRYLIAESDLNDPRYVTPPERGGLGLDAQWNDDFHHALHALLTGERVGYYRDFGAVEPLAESMREGFFLGGRYSAFRGRRHGRSSRDVPAERLVVFAQNHDQVGNRMLGDRLSTLVSFDELKLAAGAVLLAPFVPLLFMGEEYGERAPFQYFVSHTDPELVEAVRRGRREEFAAFGWEAEPPDPQDDETFLRSRLDRSVADGGPHRALRELHRELLGLRRSHPALAVPTKEGLEVAAKGDTLTLRRERDDTEIVALFNFGEEMVTATLPAGRWSRLLDSSDVVWDGEGASTPPRVAPGEAVKVGAKAFALFAREAGP
ncbi:MAG TPA: malto-oligosyltrehalose trehalohydrolase [Actinomycetota bacterium]|nr:malto-oligosyltrehalose trehalohydrolase [Actinomycetota bacterium]